MWEYVEGIRDKVHDLEIRVQKAKDNELKIQEIMTTWTKVPLYERKEDKTGHYLNIQDREDRCNKRYNDIKAKGEIIHTLLAVS